MDFGTIGNQAGGVSAVDMSAFVGRGPFRVSLRWHNHQSAQQCWSRAPDSTSRTDCVDPDPRIGWKCCGSANWQLNDVTWSSAGSTHLQIHRVPNSDGFMENLNLYTTKEQSTFLSLAPQSGYPRLIEVPVCSMRSAVQVMRSSRELLTPRAESFELFGFDVMVDEARTAPQLQIWTRIGQPKKIIYVTFIFCWVWWIVTIMLHMFIDMSLIMICVFNSQTYSEQLVLCLKAENWCLYSYASC